MYRFLILILLGQVAVTCFAQTPVYQDYTTKDGLPTNTIYGLYEDSHGYLWVGTDKGVCRFNGSEFVTIPGAQGAFVEDVYDFRETADGRIWMSSEYSLLYYVEGDTVYPYAFNHLIEELEPWPYHLHDFFIDEDSVHVSVHSRGRLSIDKKGNSTLHKGDRIKLIRMGDDFFLHHTTPAENRLRGIYTAPSVTGDSIISARLTEKDLARQTRIRKIRKAPLPSITMENLLILFKESGALKISLNSRALAHSFINDHELLVGTLGGGIDLVDVAAGTVTTDHLSLSAYTVSAIMQGRQNGLWLGTMSNGLLYIGNKNVFQFPARPAGRSNEVVNVVFQENAAFLGYRDGMIIQLNESLKEQAVYDLGVFKDNNWMWTFTANQKNDILATFTGAPNMYHIQNGRIQSINMSEELESRIYRFAEGRGYRTHATSDKFIYPLGADLEIILDSNYIGLYEALCDANCYVVDFVEARGQNRFLATSKGVFWASSSGLENLSETLDLPENCRFTDLEIHDKFLLIGSQSKGLLIWEMDQDSVAQVNAELFSSHVTCIKTVNTDHVAIGTTSGLHLLDIHATAGDRISSILANQHITSIGSSNGKIIVGTKDGAYHFDPTAFSVDRTLPKVHIKNFVSDNTPYDLLSEEIVLPSNQRSTVIGFESIDIASSSAPSYEYRLRGDPAGLCH